MSKKINFLILSTSGVPVRQMSISKMLVFSVCTVCIIALGGIGLVLQDYYQLRQQAFNNGVLKQEISGQTEVIAVQHKQIQSFAEEINSLKNRLLALNDFEKKIRLIANLEHTESRDNLFGVGGSIPGDLDPKLELEEKHNGLIREMHNQVGQIDTAANVQEDSFEALIKSLDEQKNLLSCTPAIWPAQGLLTSTFGSRKSPFTGMSEFHKGLDIAAGTGTPVIAPADGKITFADTKGGYGKLMMIQHGYGLVTCYGHLSEFLKNVGDTVKRGEQVALMGNTGRSTGPHVHYEVHLNGVPVNPENYILN